MKVAQLYEIEKILDHKKTRGGFMLLIKWLDYDSSENTWETERRIRKTSGWTVDRYWEQVGKPTQRKRAGKRGKKSKRGALLKKSRKPSSRTTSPELVDSSPETIDPPSEMTPDRNNRDRDDIELKDKACSSSANKVADANLEWLTVQVGSTATSWSTKNPDVKIKRHENGGIVMELHIHEDQELHRALEKMVS